MTPSSIKKDPHQMIQESFGAGYFCKNYLLTSGVGAAHDCHRDKDGQRAQSQAKTGGYKRVRKALQRPVGEGKDSAKKQGEEDDKQDDGLHKIILAAVATVGHGSSLPQGGELGGVHRRAGALIYP